MTEFFDVGGNQAVNIDRVRTVTFYWDPNSKDTTTVFVMDDGTQVETLREFRTNDYGPCIPAAPGTLAVAVYTHDGLSGMGRPTIGEACYYPIVGWRVEPGGTTRSSEYHLAVPIFLENPPSAGVYLPMSNGQYFKPEDRMLGSLEAVIAHELAEAQEAWDKTH